MGLFKRGQVWWMRFTYKGKQVRLSTEVSDKKLAEKIHAKVSTQIAEGKWFERPIGENKVFEEMLDKYLTEYSSSKTLLGRDRDKSIAKRLLSFFGGLKLTEIGSALVVEYKSKRRKEGAAPATIEREICVLKRSFNLAVKEWEWLRDNPVSRVSRERFNNQIDRWLTLEEEEKLLEACPDWLKQIVTFALNVGMRQGEILDLRWPYIDLFRKTATVMESKNGEKRTVPLNQKAHEVLISQSKIRHIKSDYVFVTSVGTRIGKRNLARPFTVAVAKAGIQKFRFHDLRHTFATRLIQSGIDIYTVAKLLGHKDIRMTQRYAHHSTESLRIGVEVLDRVSTNLAQSGETKEKRATALTVTL
ncbi:MAG: site-specific integrase [Deltaproteobacteria bacterium]|nr:site-specific integrase [Deltaproteobacteria bacterium]